MIFGSVPDGVEEGESRLYTVVEIGGDSVILMLEKRFGKWRENRMAVPQKNLGEVALVEGGSL